MRIYWYIIIIYSILLLTCTSVGLSQDLDVSKQHDIQWSQVYELEIKKGPRIIYDIKPDNGIISCFGNVCVLDLFKK